MLVVWDEILVFMDPCRPMTAVAASLASSCLLDHSNVPIAVHAWPWVSPADHEPTSPSKATYRNLFERTVFPAGRGSGNVAMSRSPGIVSASFTAPTCPPIPFPLESGTSRFSGTLRLLPLALHLPTTVYVWASIATISVVAANRRPRHAKNYPALQHSENGPIICRGGASLSL